LYNFFLLIEIDHPSTQQKLEATTLVIIYLNVFHDVFNCVSKKGEKYCREDTALQSITGLGLELSMRLHQELSPSADTAAALGGRRTAAGGTIR